MKKGTKVWLTLAALVLPPVVGAIGAPALVTRVLSAVAQVLLEVGDELPEAGPLDKPSGS